MSRLDKTGVALVTLTVVYLGWLVALSVGFDAGLMFALGVLGAFLVGAVVGGLAVCWWQVEKSARRHPSGRGLP